MLNDIQKAFINKHCRKNYSEQDLMRECAQDFGRLIAYAEKDGLSVPVAFEMAKNHFKTYGKAMQDFAELVSLEYAKDFIVGGLQKDNANHDTTRIKET